jgi:Fur family transcriptional regulator, ferric uptake regulator
MPKNSIPHLPQQKDEDIIIHTESYQESELKLLLRGIHLKVTDQRMALLKVLHEGRRHVTAQELFEKIQPAYPEMGFATVYRFLKTLHENNLVTEVRQGGASARFELIPKGHHDHLTCTQCGMICEFENKAIEELQNKVAQQFGFKLTHHVLELHGLCPSCQSLEQSEGKNGKK